MSSKNIVRFVQANWQEVDVDVYEHFTSVELCVDLLSERLSMRGYAKFNPNDLAEKYSRQHGIDSARGRAIQRLAQFIEENDLMLPLDWQYCEDPELCTCVCDPETIDFCPDKA